MVINNKNVINLNEFELIKISGGNWITEDISYAIGYAYQSVINFANNVRVAAYAASKRNLSSYRSYPVFNGG